MSQGFRPFQGGRAQIIAVSHEADQRTALELPSAQGGFHLLLYNDTDALVFVRAGLEDFAASGTDYAMIVPPKGLIIYGVPAGATHLAHHGGPGNLHVIAGGAI